MAATEVLETASPNLPRPTIALFDAGAGNCLFDTRPNPANAGTRGVTARI